MASKFDGDVALDVPLLLTEFGVDVTYRPLSDSANDKTIKAIIEPGHPEPVFGEGNSIQEYKIIECQISARDDTEGHKSPTQYDGKAVGDQVLVDGTVYYLRRLVSNDAGGMHRLRLTDKLVPFTEEY